MYAIVWHYQTKHGHAAEFERVYGPQGDWAKFFRRSPSFGGSELLRDAEEPHRYIAIDHWVSVAAYEAFMAEHRAQYDALNVRCAPYYSEEECLGRFTAVG